MQADPRQERGHKIATNEGQVFRVAEGFYRVKSQSVDRYYDVNNTTIGWKCNCPDHKFRGAIYEPILRFAMWLISRSRFEG
jgi:hypothetical protein